MKIKFFLFFAILFGNSSFAQNNHLIQLESDTLVRGFDFLFKYDTPAKYDTLLIQLEGCKGRLVLDSSGAIFADSLSSSCRISILKVLDNDTTLYSSKTLIIEDLKPPKFQVGGFDIMNLKQKHIEFSDFKLKLVNVTQPRLLRYLSFFLKNIILEYNGKEITLQYGDRYLDFENIFLDSKKGDVILVKSFSYMEPTKRGRHKVIINKTFKRVGIFKFQNKFLVY